MIMLVRIMQVQHPSCAGVPVQRVCKQPMTGRAHRVRNAYSAHFSERGAKVRARLTRRESRLDLIVNHSARTREDRYVLALYTRRAVGVVEPCAWRFGNWKTRPERENLSRNDCTC